MKLPRCVLVGDSISASMRATRGHRTIQWYAQRRLPGYHLIEYARPGWTVGWPLAWRPDPAAVSALMPNVVVTWLGVNDYLLGATATSFGSAYERHLSALDSATAPVGVRHVLVLPGWYAAGGAQNGHGATLEDLRDVLRGIAATRGVALLDPREAVPAGESVSYDDRPELHYNDRGNRKVGIWLGRTLKAVLP